MTADEFCALLDSTTVVDGVEKRLADCTPDELLRSTDQLGALVDYVQTLIDAGPQPI